MDANLLKGTTLHIPTDFVNNNINRDKADEIAAALYVEGLSLRRLEGVGTTYLDIN